MPAPGTPKQTLSFLLKRFEESGLRPDSRHGQNFLIDLNLVRLLADSARLGTDDVVLEVGTGTGSLTALLAPRAAAVVSVEIDPQMHQLASESLIDAANVRLLRMDALKNKNRLNPQLLEVVREELAIPGRRLKLETSPDCRGGGPAIPSGVRRADNSDYDTDDKPCGGASADR